MDDEVQQSFENLNGYFHQLSTDDQFKFISKFISSSSFLVKWKLKVLLDQGATSDLLCLLPQELKHIIFSFLDSKSIFQTLKVSKTWNSMIKEFHSIWHNLCDEIGVNIAAKPNNISWYEAFITSLQQLKAMQIKTAFLSKSITLQNMLAPVKLLDYNDGFLCSVTDDETVTVWLLELNVPLVVLHPPSQVASIKFRANRTLLCGHFTGKITAWHIGGVPFCALRMGTIKLTPAFSQSLICARTEGRHHSLLRCTMSMHAGPVFTLDFKENLQLAVSGGTDFTMRLWCLKTGLPLKTINLGVTYPFLSPNYQFISPEGVTLISGTCREGEQSSHTLLVATQRTAHKFEWPAASPTAVKEHQVPAGQWGDLNSLKDCGSVGGEDKDPDGRSVSSVFVCDHRVTLVRKDEGATYETMEVVEAEARPGQSTKQLLRVKARRVLGVGERLAVVLCPGTSLYLSGVAVIRISTGKIVTMFDIKYSKLPSRIDSKIVLGDINWLDGLKGWDLFPEFHQSHHKRHRGNNTYSTDSDTIHLSSTASDNHSMKTEIEKAIDAVERGQEFPLHSREGEPLPPMRCAPMDTHQVGPRCPCRGTDKYGIVYTEEPPITSWSKSLVLATAVPAEDGKVFSLWWKSNDDQENKRKME